MNINTLNLSKKALLIATERPEAWEFILFGQVVADEVEKSKRSIPQNLYSASIQRTSDEIENAKAVTKLVAEKLEEIRSIMNDFTSLLDADHSDAFGDLGNPENTSAIVRLAREVGAFHNRFLKWSLPLGKVPSELPYSKIPHELGSIGTDIYVAGLERFGPHLIKQIDDAKNGLLGDDYSINYLEWIETPELDRSVERILALNNELELASQSITTQLELSSKAGYLYVLVNPSITGQVKIGKTTRNPNDRAKELGAPTGVPTPFIVAFETSVDDCDAAEKYVHNKLRNCRVSSNREFFRISPTEAIKVILEAQQSI